MSKTIYALLVLGLSCMLLSAKIYKKNGRVETPEPWPPAADEMVSFTVDGNLFSAPQLSIGGETDSSVGAGFFVRNEVRSGVVVSGNLSSTVKINVMISFGGQKTGHYKVGGEDYNSIVIMITDKGTKRYFSGLENAVSLIVDSYEGIGGKMEGTFAGTFTEMAGDESITIRNGHFNVTRIADQL